MIDTKNHFSDESLESMRAKIDAIDSEILSLIEARERCAIQIWSIKKHLSHPPVYYVPEREQAILSRIEKTYQGHFSPDMIRSIFEIIILNCRLLQK